MLKQSLEAHIFADNKGLNADKSSKTAAEQERSAIESDLSGTTKEFANAQADFANAKAAADHEAIVVARNEELAVIAKAKAVLQETSGGGVAPNYSSFPWKMIANFRNIEVIIAIKQLAQEQHFVALAQLVSCIVAVATYGVANGEGPFAKAKGNINMTAKLEKETEAHANDKAYCDEGLAKPEATKQELDGEIAALTAKIDRVAAKSAGMTADAKEFQEELTILATEQAETDSMRAEQNQDHFQAKSDLTLALNGVLNVFWRAIFGDARETCYMLQHSRPLVKK